MTNDSDQPSVPTIASRTGIMFIVIMFLAQIVVQSTPAVQQWWTERKPAEDFYEVKLLDYQGTDRDLLLLQRTEVVHKKLDTITWSRQLWCESDDRNSDAIYSTDIAIAILNYEPSPVRTLQVFYDGPFPNDRVCHIRSVAVFTVDGVVKQTTVMTGPFEPGAR